MRRGEKIGPQVERRIRELASDYPGFTQERIAKEIFKELHIKVHRSTVGRCLQIAGIRPRIPRKSDRGEIPPGTIADQATRDHIENLRSLVRKWQQQCQVYPLSEAIRQFAVPKMVEDLLIQATEDGEATRLYSIPTTPDNEHRYVLIEMAAEKDELLPSLQEHLEPTPISQEYARWREKTRDYLFQLGFFFRTAAAINMSDGHLPPQYMRFERAHMLVPLVLTCDLLAFGLRELPSQRWPKDQLDGLRNLRSKIVAVGETNAPKRFSSRVLAQAKAVWNDSDDSSGAVAACREVVATIAQLQKITENLKTQLKEIEGQHPFPGHCSQCP